MKPTVDVSILATNYNNGAFLDDFFQSIISSTVSPKELIFVDDGSTDDSINIIKKYNSYKFIKVIIFEKNKGRAAALNAGKDACTAKYTLLIDPDDILLPNRIEKQYNFMEKNTKIDVLGGNVEYFNSENNKILNTSNFTQTNFLEVFKNGENAVLQPTVIIKTAVFKKYEYKQIVPGQDYELFARIILDGYKFANLPDVLNKMRVHPNSAVSNMKISSIQNIFKQRDLIFNTKTSKLKSFIYYHHLNNYRKGMLSDNNIKKYYFYFLSSILNPLKIIKRIISSISSYRQ
ncbi:MAG: glycosyltransferase [Bacteroidales bacterium]|nr:glycosyltransferase [Bacteroidales bacterium]